ncbi:alpha/beta hydrolase [Arenibacter sp. TNZ]|uniref:alpha/beta fold hydrolase n=1 Tax=Arenibacter TaxID=178469 RepID=UPI000CD3E587|nr:MULTISPECIES: alpha/beta hydrolase [Arenibacter]MCM4170348.1 alpha/beta hydrolase [Arenibacter sp. TNZ]
MQKLLYHILALSYGVYFNSIALFSTIDVGQKAFNLFSTPRKGRILPDQMEYLQQFLGEKILVNNTRLQTYTCFGAQETVLLLHGWESNAFRWRNLIEKLREREFNIIAFDAPGHGYSEGKNLNVVTYAESARHLIDIYKPKYIIGHSMGGLATLHNQYQNPNTSIEKIVTLGAPAELSELMAHYQNLLKFNNKVLQSLDQHLYEHHNFRIKDISTPMFAQSITQKGLIIHDEWDNITPFSASERLHKNWKNSRLIKTKGLGHSLHQEDLNLQIVDFLKS